jgi:hypothetical protein
MKNQSRATLELIRLGKRDIRPKYRFIRKKGATNVVHIKRTNLEADSKTRQGGKTSTIAGITGLFILRKSTKLLKPVNMGCQNRKLNGA